MKQLHLERLMNPRPCQQQRKGGDCGRAARFVVAGKRICTICLAELQDGRRG